MPKVILVVEDDHLQEGPLEAHLQSAFPGMQIKTINTEHEFRRRFDELRAVQPSVVIMDVMLRWADPSPMAEEPPPVVVEGGYYRAGLRCAALMHEDATLRNVPVIFYSVVERSDLERDGTPLGSATSYLRKSPDPSALVRKIRAVAAVGK